MRKPLIFLLIVFSFWIWSLDLVDIAFYYAKYPYTPVTGYITALLPFCILAYFFLRLFFKFYGFDKKAIRFTKKHLREYIYLLLFFSPILYLNFKRIMFPDLNFDTGAYHLYLQELNRYENLKNFNLVGGPGGGTYFFTLSDKIFGAFRKLLGFRMGTIFNTYLLFLCFVSLYDFMKMVVISHLGKLKAPLALAALSSLFIIYADNTLFNLNSYLIDLVGVPIMLELVFIICFKKLVPENGSTVTLFFFILTSLLITYKLTYLPYAFILSVCFIINNYSFIYQRKKILLLCFVTLLFPSIYLLYNYSETHNPIFPFFNKLFKSPLYEIKNFKDERWGPGSFLEAFYYNISCAINGKRTNEWGFFSVRLLAEYFIILSCLTYLIVNKFRFTSALIKVIFNVSGIAILLNYMLIFTTGYYRYGIIIEMLFGLCIVLWLFYFYQRKKHLLFSGLFILSLIQCITTYNRIYKHGMNLSWYNYEDLWHNRREEVKDQIHLLGIDKRNDVSMMISHLKIDGFLSSDCDGYIKLLLPNVPIYNVTSYGSRKELITGFEKNVVDTFSKKHNLYCLARTEGLDQKIRDLNNNNYSVDTVINICPVFTSKEMPLYLLKIKYQDRDSLKIKRPATL